MKRTNKKTIKYNFLIILPYFFVISFIITLFLYKMNSLQFVLILLSSFCVFIGFDFIYSYLKWLNFYYEINDSLITIHKGIIFKSKKEFSLKYEFENSFLLNLFKLKKLVIINTNAFIIDSSLKDLELTSYKKDKNILNLNITKKDLVKLIINNKSFLLFILIYTFIYLALMIFYFINTLFLISEFCVFLLIYFIFILLIFSIIYLIFKYLYFDFKIKYDENKIILKNQTIKIKDIEEIILKKRINYCQVYCLINHKKVLIIPFMKENNEKNYLNILNISHITRK